MNLARSSYKLFLGKIIGSLTQFVGVAYFARELGSAAVGVFFLFEALLGMLAIPANFGLQRSLEKRMSEGDAQSRFLSSAVLLKSLPVAAIIVGILIASEQLNNYLGSDAAHVLAIAIALQEFSRMWIYVLKGELRVGETAVLNVLKNLTWVVVGTMLVSQGYEEMALIYGLLAGLTVMTAIGWHKSSTRFARPTKRHMRSLFDYGKYNFVASIGGYFYNWMDIVIIGYFLSQSHVGAYEVAWRVTLIVILFSRSLGTSLFPQISRWYKKGSQTKIEREIKNHLTLSMVVVVPAVFGTILLSKDILGLVFGSEFTIAWVALIVLMFEKFLQSLHIILGRSLQAIDRPDLAAKASLVSVFANLLLNVLLVPIYGIVGAAVATTLSAGINGLTHGIYLQRHIDVIFPYKNLSYMIISSIGMSLVLLVFTSLTSVDTLLILSATIIVGVLSYLMFSFSFSPLRYDILSYLWGIRS